MRGAKIIKGVHQFLKQDYHRFLMEPSLFFRVYYLVSKIIKGVHQFLKRDYHRFLTESSLLFRVYYLVVGTVIGIVTIVVVLPFILLITFASLPAWGAAILLIFLSQYLFRVYSIKELNSSETLSKMVTVSIDKNSNKLNWSLILKGSQVEPYIGNNVAISIFLSIVIGVVSLVIILPLLYRNGNFNWLKFDGDEISPHTGLVWGYIMSGIIILITLVISKPKKSLEKSIKERVNHLASKVNTQLEKIDELCYIENSIKSIASKLKVSFPADYQTEIKKYIDANKVKILLDSAVLNNVLNNLIVRKIEQAQEDRSHLEKALKLYNTAEGFYKQVSYEVIKIGSVPFVKILEDVYERLNSENVCSLLITRKWKEYDDVINTTIEILNDLHEQATNYQDEGYKKERTIYTEETDEEKAYRILGVPSTATNEQINKVWKILVSTWHPDGKQGEVREKHEAQTKEINWAYDVLKKKRNIT